MSPNNDISAAPHTGVTADSSDHLVPGPPAPPPNFRRWLADSSVYLIIFVAIATALFKYGGLDGIYKAGLSILGLGFIVFVHELGHFLAAKWCDVHVQTFSIGFGPALPGCSFVRGETLYKLAVVPLGGYVAMVGEGPDADEGDDYPRSFKNKTVGQRMLIISAGVIMNIILGCICFILVFRLAGKERTTGVVGGVEPGSPAWVAGVRSGTVIKKIGKKENPYFENLQTAVWFNRDDSIPFVFEPRNGGPAQNLDLTPRREPGQDMPTIGVTGPRRLQLLVRPPDPVFDFPRQPPYRPPVQPRSAAAAARVLSLQPGDVVEAASEAGNSELTDLKQPWFDSLERRLGALVDQDFKVRIRRSGQKTADADLNIPKGGFEFGDIFLATTDPATPDSPYQLKDLPPDPTDPDNPSAHDFVEFSQRMSLLAGKPVVIRIRREGKADPIDLFVPGAFHSDTGLRMKMGEIAAVRDGSPAALAGLKAGENLGEVKVSWAGSEGEIISMKDPTRLLFELRQAYRRAGQPAQMLVTCKVPRPNPDTHTVELQPLPPMIWDNSWRFQEDLPFQYTSPLSIPELGIAYRVESTIAAVVPVPGVDNSSFKEGDIVVSVRYESESMRVGEPATWSRWIDIKSNRGPNHTEVYDQWGFVSAQLEAALRMEVNVNRAGQVLPDAMPIGFATDETWPMDQRGFAFMPEMRLQKANSIGEAVQFGAEETWTLIGRIYQGLERLAKGKFSFKTFGGPIEIGKTAYLVAEKWDYLLLFMGMISINLAVVNFLPIPVLDGGHMVFLIYEWLRGKPPSETVRAVATWIGLALLLSLMICVCFQDIFKLDIVRRLFRI